MQPSPILCDTYLAAPTRREQRFERGVIAAMLLLMPFVLVAAATAGA